MASFLYAPGPITAVWASCGDDKVARNELRSITKETVILSKCWDGTRVRLLGLRGDIVTFNLVLEASSSNAANNVSVEFSSLRSDKLIIRPIPKRLRRSDNYRYSCVGWVNRTFSIPARRSQSIPADIFISGNAPPGEFHGEILIKVNGLLCYRVPVQLSILHHTRKNSHGHLAAAEN